MEHFKLICIYIIIIFIIHLLYDITISKITYNINDIPMYCIYIPNREKYIKKLFRKLNLQPNFIQGIDKNIIDIDNLIKNKKVKKYKNVNQGRIACHYSHLKVLKDFLETDKERCIIFEDDLKTKYNTFNTVNLLFDTLHNIPDDCDILYLGYCWEKCNKVKSINKYISYSFYPRCRHAYMVNRHGAKIIIDNTSVMYNSGDEMYADLIKNGKLKSCTSTYGLFIQNRENLGSNLDNNRIDIIYSCNNL